MFRDETNSWKKVHCAKGRNGFRYSRFHFILLDTKKELKKMEAEFESRLASNAVEVKKHEKLGMEKVKAVEEMLKQTEEVG